jgi:hypothetical protein
LKNALVAISVLIVILLGAIALLSTGTGQDRSNITASSSLSTGVTQTTTTTFAKSLSMVSGQIVPASGSPVVSSEQDWSVNLTDYSYPPNFVSFDPESGEIYVSGAPSQVVTMVNPSTHSVSGTFEVPGTIYSGPILPDPEAGTLLVFALICSGEPGANSSTCPPADEKPSLFVLKEGTKAVMSEFTVSGGEYSVDLVTGILYASESCPNPHGGVMNPVLPDCGFLLKYDLATGSLLDNVSLNAPAYSLAVDSETGMVYFITGSTFAGYSQDFVAFNGTDDHVVSELPFDTISTPVLQVDPGTDTVFSLATNGSSTVITAVDGATGGILYSSPLGSACSVDSNRYRVNPVTNQIYASDYNDTSGNYLLVVNASDGRLVNMVSTLGDVYEDSTSNPVTGEVYLLAGTQLVALPPELPGAYVNPSILTYSNCQDMPV